MIKREKNSSALGYSSVGIGTFADHESSGSQRVCIGYNAGKANVTLANDDVSIGTYAGYNGQSGENVYIGNRAGYNSRGQRNVYIGQYGGGQGHDNVALGPYAGQSLDGSGNVFLGYQAGKDCVGNNNIELVTNGISTSFLNGVSNRLHIDNTILGDMSSGLVYCW